MKPTLADAPLTELESRGDFIRRHLGPDRQQLEHMARSLGLAAIEDIVSRAVPADIVTQTSLALTETISERAVQTHLRSMRARNRVNISMIGMGYYGTLMPEVIKRNVLENPGWYTAYTPYQAEISQGRLEALLNFQQLVIDLTGLPVANASMLDEATAAAEAMTMSRRLSQARSNRYVVDADCHPQTVGVLRTRARHLDIEIALGDAAALARSDCFGVLLQYPGSSGALRDWTSTIAAAHSVGALATVAADPLALVLLRSPGSMDADIAIGSAQRFGVPMGYGGPHAAFFATRERYVRAMPGRIIGVSVDREGRPALRMALQTREQHIRREKATSNICTAQVLLAVLAGFYAVYHGPKGLAVIAERVHRLTSILRDALVRRGYEVETGAWFDTLTLHVPHRARQLAARAREAGINLRVVSGDRLGLSFDETINRAALRTLWRVFARDGDDELDFRTDDEVARRGGIPSALRRVDPILAHPVFARHHSETEMMRYMRRLARRDIALDRAMIPLGSCTMKLNAATELAALSYREFSDLHPFVPLDQAQGYQQMFAELEAMLCDLTGFSAFSLQPNAGSQGEYAGLLVIRKYHEVRGEGARDVCLIPSSAHGTNPASAALAGLRVVIVACDARGNVDLADLEAKACEHAARLAALMVTYPSTHGVFEPSIRQVCDIAHAHGGQVYLDGANFNALVGICRPAEVGADVMHVNLHKTFAIPHGGGGPGMGPIGVKPHLMPYLPDHPVVDGVNPAAGPEGTIGPVSAAPWGSASILTISWAYIAMMGAKGLRRATSVAILAANYVAQRLAPHYPVLYTGQNGMVAHECIIDLGAIKQATAVTVDDVAKRLVDYGFHAPTMSFPVADTLMIEPTESENQRELDRFCDAMIAIRGEIRAIEEGLASREDNLLKRAPHTHHLLLEEHWERPYTKQQAFFPMPDLHEDKYWPPVARIDNAHGDKHLVCGCPPLEAWAEAAS
jgi:glycine dehydrogenase